MSGETSAPGPVPARSPRPASRSSRMKNRFVRGLYWMLPRVPRWLFSLTVKLLIGLVRVLYWLPGNPLRQAAGYASTLAARAGHSRSPWSVYRRLTGQIGMALEGFFAIYRDGVEANLYRVFFPPESVAVIRRCLDEHNGVILTVPHNPGGVFSAFRLNHEVPTLLLTRQDPGDVEKSAMQNDIFDHLAVEVLMAKGATPRQVLRTCVEGARQGKAVVFSVDNLHTGRKGAIGGEIFGQAVEMGSWASRMARHAGVPILPAFVGERDGAFYIHTGEPLMVQRPEEGVRHYLAFFEERILADPGSWAYLGDRKWRRVLEAAASRNPEP